MNSALAVLLAIVIISSGVTVARAEDSSDRISYYYYMVNHASAARPEEEINVPLSAFEADTDGSVVYYEHEYGSDSGLMISKECSSVTLHVNVPADGLYCMEMKYLPMLTADTQILFGLQIDGKVPFVEANSLVLSRVYQNEPIVQDSEGNDIRPRAEQKSLWLTQYLRDQTGINGSLAFYMEKGEHELTLLLQEAEMLIESLVIKQEPYILSYQDYVSLHSQMGHKKTEDILQIYQAESYYYQSSSVLWPDTDRSSPLTQPFDYLLKKINIGGGSQWKMPGDWISWKIDVPEDGFYNIGIKYKQGYLDGLFSSRMLKIDGQVPFEELKAIRFPYTAQWENMLLGSEYEPYLFYLTAGEHVFTLENVLGDMESTMSVLQTCVNNLNELYLSIIMITGSDPDKYRDYYLTKLLPELPGELKENAELLFREADRLVEVVGEKGRETAYFEDIAYNLISYADNIMDLTFKQRLTDLKNDISSLGAKMSEYREQALDIDFFVVCSSNKEMPRVHLSAGEWMTYQAKSFAASFESDDNNDIWDKDRKNGNADIHVWMGGGNRQFEIVRSMIDDLFTPQTGITVDLVLGGTGLINATLTNVGPDVMMGSADTVDMAIRGALVRLDEFPGYDELMQEYVPGINIPNTLEGGVYAISTGGGCNMLFVRTDIFERLNLKIPTTWDEMLDIAQVLQRNNMQIGAAPSFLMLLYQNGGAIYDDQLLRVRLDEDIAINALKQNSEYYTKYGFPIAYDLVTQFRTGEMPIALSPYSTYNTLKYSAPEISGLWKMFPIPGTLREDGTIDTTQPVMGEGGGIIIPKTSKNVQGAWEFIKWWCGAEAQERYAKDIEGALGISARAATLNLEVLPKLGWTRDEYEVILEGITQLEFVPVVPGDYFINRGLTFITREAYNAGTNIREMMEEWTVKINEEMARKRREFYKNNKLVIR